MATGDGLATIGATVCLTTGYKQTVAHGAVARELDEFNVFRRGPVTGMLCDGPEEQKRTEDPFFDSAAGDDDDLEGELIVNVNGRTVLMLFRYDNPG